MQGIQKIKISRKRHRRRHIVLHALRGKIGESNVGEQTVGKARAVAFLIIGDDGHSHVECVAGGSAARPRIGIESNVHIEIALHIVLRRRFKAHTTQIKTKPTQTLPRHNDNAALVVLLVL